MLICKKPVHFLLAQMALVSTILQMFIVLGMFNFGCYSIFVCNDACITKVIATSFLCKCGPFFKLEKKSCDWHWIEMDLYQKDFHVWAKTFCSVLTTDTYLQQKQLKVENISRCFQFVPILKKKSLNLNISTLSDVVRFFEHGPYWKYLLKFSHL